MAFISNSKTASEMRDEVIRFYDNNIEREQNVLKFKRTKRGIREQELLINRLIFDRDFWSFWHERLTY
jgi:hypothetical protein